MTHDSLAALRGSSLNLNNGCDIFSMGSPRQSSPLHGTLGAQRSTLLDMADPSFDVAVADRWFASSLNNATWDWLESHPTGERNDPIIHTAHAAYHHWRQIGTTINQARAASVLANVHAACGNGDLAESFARECLDLIATAGDEATDWDLAFGHDSLARAFATLAHPDAKTQREQARTLGDAIVDPDDKAVFDAWFGRAETVD